MMISPPENACRLGNSSVVSSIVSVHAQPERAGMIRITHKSRLAVTAVTVGSNVADVLTRTRVFVDQSRSSRRGLKSTSTLCVRVSGISDLSCSRRGSAHQCLQRGHDTEGDCRDDALELAQLAEEAKEAKGPQDPQLLDPAVVPTSKAFILAWHNQ